MPVSYVEDSVRLKERMRKNLFEYNLSGYISLRRNFSEREIEVLPYNYRSISVSHEIGYTLDPYSVDGVLHCLQHMNLYKNKEKMIASFICFSYYLNEKEIEEIQEAEKLSYFARKELETSFGSIYQRINAKVMPLYNQIIRDYNSVKQELGSSKTLENLNDKFYQRMKNKIDPLKPLECKLLTPETVSN